MHSLVRPNGLHLGLASMEAHLEHADEKGGKTRYRHCDEHGHIVSQQPSPPSNPSRLTGLLPSAGVAAIIKTTVIHTMLASDIRKWATMGRFGRWFPLTSSVNRGRRGRHPLGGRRSRRHHHRRIDARLARPRPGGQEPLEG